MNSARAAAGMKRTNLPISISPFGELELTNAISLRLFRGELKAAQATAAHRLVRQDIEGGVLESKPIPGAAFERAKRIARLETPRFGTRTIDVLHVALALQFGADAFYTFDLRQAKLAVAEGLALTY
jgi:predicted nucleic acid-binding protein